MDDDNSTPEFPSSRWPVRRGRLSWRRSRDRDADRSRSGSSGGPDEEDFPPFEFVPPAPAARGSVSGEAGGGSQPPVDDSPAGPPQGAPPQEAAPPVPPAGAAPPPSGGADGGVPLRPSGAGGTGGSRGGGDDDLPPFDFKPPAAAVPSGYESPRRGAARPRITRRERQKQLRRHRLIVLGVFVVVLIILIVIMVKACGAGGGAAQPKPHKTKVHKTTAAGVKASTSPFDVAVNAVQATQGDTVQVNYRIDGPAGAMGSVKIVVKNKSGKVVEYFTLGARQPTNRDLTYRFLAVLDPGTYSYLVQVSLSTGVSASGSSRLTVVPSAGATPSPTST